MFQCQNYNEYRYISIQCLFVGYLTSLLLISESSKVQLVNWEALRSFFTKCLKLGIIIMLHGTSRLQAHLNQTPR